MERVATLPLRGQQVPRQQHQGKGKWIHAEKDETSELYPLSLPQGHGGDHISDLITGKPWRMAEY